MGGQSFCWRESRNREEGGGDATHNLALHLLSPPPVTRLKIKIKIKWDGGSSVGAIALWSMERGCKGDSWLNITRCMVGSSKERGYFQEAGHHWSPHCCPDNIHVSVCVCYVFGMCGPHMWWSKPCPPLDIKTSMCVCLCKLLLHIDGGQNTHTQKGAQPRKDALAHIYVSLRLAKGSISDPPRTPAPLLQRKKSQRDFWWEKCAFLRWWSDREGVQPNVKDDKWKGAETRSHTHTHTRANTTQAGRHWEEYSSSLTNS